LRKSTESGQEVSEPKGSKNGEASLEEALQDSNSHYRTVFDHVSDAILIHDFDGRFLEVNRVACECLKSKREKLLQMGTSDIDAFRYAGLLPERIKELSQRGPITVKTIHRRPDGMVVPIELKNRIISYNGNPAALTIARDITERSKTEEMLRQSEELYRAVVTQTADPIYLIDLETRYLIESNPACQRLLGYTPEELKKLTVYDLVSHEKGNVNFHIEQVISEGRHFHGERKLRRKDGALLDAEVTANLINYSGRKVICAVARNISERKKAEQALQESEMKLRLLSSHLLTAQEKERKRISIEVHDELGQSLLVLKLQLRAIEKKLEKDQVALREDCRSTLKYIDQTIENVRRLSRDLSPSILEDLGLTASLQWLMEDFEKHHEHIKISGDITEIDNMFLQEGQIIIYRIFQEAFTNIVKHAEATCVYVIIQKKGDHVYFSVEDDGKGFDAGTIYTRHAAEKGLGLAAMDERIRMLKGFLDVRSQKGRGTKITFILPVVGEKN
jgi:PAS domain S-box-containing protein